MILVILRWWLAFAGWMGTIPKELATIQIPEEIARIVTPPVTTSPKPTGHIFRTPTRMAQDPNLPQEWGVAKQVGEHTWTMRVGQDEKMGSPQEIMGALNDYRRRFGAAILMWDEKLANFAQSRADYFDTSQGLDSHKGFGEFLEKEDGFNKLGFNAVGENSSYGYVMTGTHLIEWIFAGDEPHNKNQLNKDWAYVGIGIKNEAVDIIFGTGKF